MQIIGYVLSALLFVIAARDQSSPSRLDNISDVFK